MLSPTHIPFACRSAINYAAMPIENFDAGEKPMSQEKQRLLDEMEPLVKQVLDCCDESAINQLVKLNAEMIETNVRENLFPVEHCVPVRHLVGANRKRICLMETVPNFLESAEDLKQAEAARKEIQTLQSNLRAYLMELKLPPSWTFEIPDVGIHRPAGREQLSNANGNNACTIDFLNAQSSNVTHDWTPGQTTRGENILAFRPTTMTGVIVNTDQVGQIFSNVWFVIEREGERNPIEIVDEARVGSKAVTAYLGLPQEQKCNLTHVDKRYDRSDDYKFGRIKGVARDSAATDRKLPWTVVLIEYDGQLCIVNRTALRNAKKERVADALINEFLISVGEEPDAPKQVRRLRNAENGLLLEQYGSSGRFGNRITRSTTGSPRMLGNQEEDSYYDFDTPDHGRARMPVGRDSRFGDQNRGVAFNTPRESYRPTSARSQGPTQVHTASRTSTTDTPPDMIRDEQRRTGAAAGEQPVTQKQLSDLMELLHQLTVKIGGNQGAQEPAAATQ
jgi:hypothetical protein